MVNINIPFDDCGITIIDITINGNTKIDMMTSLKLLGLHLLTCLVSVGTLTNAIDVYNCCADTDNDITLRSSLWNNSKYDYDMYYGHLDCLFCQNGVMIGEHCLKAGQVDRFRVKANDTKDMLTVTLSVRYVQKEDEGVYILLVAQGKDDDRHIDVTDTYIDVITPPGPVDCEVVSSSYSPDWNEVHCSAPLGMDSDPQASISCFQNNVKAPFLSPPVYSSNHIQAVFWMNAQSSINCCSFAPQCEKRPELCLEFVYPSKNSSDLFEENDSEQREATTPRESTIGQSTILTMLTTLKYADSYGETHQTCVVLISCIAVSCLVTLAVVVIISWRYVNKHRVKYLSYQRPQIMETCAM